MNQGIGEGAERLTEELADLLGRPCRPGSCADIERRRGGSAVPAKYSTLDEDGALGQRQFVEPGAQFAASGAADQLGHLAGGKSGRREIIFLDTADDGSVTGNGRHETLGIGLIHAGYGPFDEMMAGHFDGCLFLGTGINLELRHRGFDQAERLALVAQHQSGQLIELDRRILRLQKAAFTIAVPHGLNLRYTSLFILTEAQSGVKLPGVRTVFSRSIYLSALGLLYSNLCTLWAQGAHCAYG